jgi:dipeptidyl aminopeptidase/acylaminoacyl peptidase
VDCFAAARSLAERGQVDPARMCIRGGSAGGFATLRALARQDTPFAAGADYYGLVNLEVIARETHKFESRMLDAELSFYAQLFALVLPAAEEIEPVAIEGFPTGHEKGGQSPA